MKQPSVRFQTLFRNRFTGPILLLLLVIAANYNIVFLGQSLVASANYNPIDYRLTHQQPGLAQGSFAIGNWHDLGVAWWQWEPAGKLFSKEFRAGRVPLWDPDVGGGIDAHSALQQGQYYPPYILLLLAGNTALLRDMYYLLQVFIAGFFCYLLLRSYGCHPISAVAMGVAYMLGGALTQNVNSIEGQAVAVIPAMVWAVDRLLRLGSWRAAGVASIILAIATLTSFLPIVLSGYLLVGILVLITWSWQIVLPETGQTRVHWRQWAKPVAAIAVSLLLTAFLTVPVRAAEHLDEVFSKWYPGAGEQHYSFDRVLTLLSPSVTFDVNQTFTAASTQLFQAPVGYMCFLYVGLIPVLLCFLGFPKSNPALRRLHLFFAIAAAFVFLKLLGVPPAQWIGYLPVFKDLHFIPYFCGALNYPIAGLAGLGIEKLIRQRSARTLGIGIIVSVAVFVAILRFDQTQPINPVLQGPTLWNDLAHHGLELARMGLLAAGFVSILALRARNLRGTTAGMCMLALIFLDLSPLGSRLRFLRSDVWDDPPEYVRFLQSDHSVFRVHSLYDRALTADTSQAYGIHVVSSREPFNSTRYTEVLRKYFDMPFIPYPMAKTLLSSARPVLDILNIKYLILLNPPKEEVAQVTTAGLVLKNQDGMFQVFQNPTVWDRAYVASSVRLESKPAQSLNDLADLRPGEVTVEKKPAVDLSAGPAGSVESLQFDYDKITLRVRAARPSLLVLDENYSPGWHARVQGKPAEILRANYAFQAVAVPQGVSDVQFRFTPPGLYAGLAVTFVGLILLGAMIFPPFRKWDAKI